MSSSSDSLSECSESESDVYVQNSQVMLTRRQAKAKAESERVDQAASIQSGATPVSLDKIDSSRSDVVKAGETCIVAGGESPESYSYLNCVREVITDPPCLVNR